MSEVPSRRERPRRTTVTTVRVNLLSGASSHQSPTHRAISRAGRPQTVSPSSCLGSRTQTGHDSFMPADCLTYLLTCGEDSLSGRTAAPDPGIRRPATTKGSATHRQTRKDRFPSSPRGREKSRRKGPRRVRDPRSNEWIFSSLWSTKDFRQHHDRKIQK